MQKRGLLLTWTGALTLTADVDADAELTADEALSWRLTGRVGLDLEADKWGRPVSDPGKRKFAPRAGGSNPRPWPRARAVGRC